MVLFLRLRRFLCRRLDYIPLFSFCLPFVLSLCLCLCSRVNQTLTVEGLYIISIIYHPSQSVVLNKCLNFFNRKVLTKYPCIGENNSELSFEADIIITNGKPAVVIFGKVFSQSLPVHWTFMKFKALLHVLRSGRLYPGVCIRLKDKLERVMSRKSASWTVVGFIAYTRMTIARQKNRTCNSGRPGHTAKRWR